MFIARSSRTCSNNRSISVPFWSVAMSLDGPKHRERRIRDVSRMSEPVLWVGRPHLLQFQGGLNLTRQPNSGNTSSRAACLSTGIFSMGPQRFNELFFLAFELVLQHEFFKHETYIPGWSTLPLISAFRMMHKHLEDTSFYFQVQHFKFQLFRCLVCLPHHYTKTEGAHIVHRFLEHLSRFFPSGAWWRYE